MHERQRLSVIVKNYLTPISEGHTNIARNIIKALKSVYKDLKIVAIEPIILRKLLPNNVKVCSMIPVRNKFLHDIFLKLRLYDVYTALKMKKYITDIDIICFTNVPAYVYLLMLKPLISSSRKNIIAYLWYKSRNPLEVYLLRKLCTKVIVTSEFLKAFYLSKKLEHITCIPPPIDEYLFKPYNMYECRRYLGLDREAFLIGYIGEAITIRGFDILFKAFMKLPSSTKLVIASTKFEHSMLNILKEYVRRFRDRIIILKSMLYEEVPIFYNAVDIVVLPFRRPYEITEPPLVVIEALTCGRPLIVAPVGSISEFVSEERAILVKPGDVNDLKNAIEYLMDNEREKRKLGQNAREYAVKNFSLEVAGHKLKKIFEEIVK